MSLSKRGYKFRAGDRVKANQKAPGDYEGHGGFVVSRGPGKCEYAVQFDSDARGIAYLNSWCLDRNGSAAPSDDKHSHAGSCTGTRSLQGARSKSSPRNIELEVEWKYSKS